MHPFDYRRPATLEEAIQLRRAQAEACWLAGGMTLIPLLKQRLARAAQLIDLTAVTELRGIASVGAELILGSGATHDAVARSTEVNRAIPALARLAGSIGDPQVRNRGTLGGALATNDPAGDWAAAVLALNATVITDRRQLAAGDFFTGLMQTALAPDELIVGVRFPVPFAAAYERFRQSASRYPLAGVFVARLPDGVRVAVTGAGACVFRHLAMEEALDHAFTPDAVAAIATPSQRLVASLHGSAAYRAHLVNVLAGRAVAAARAAA